MNCKRGFRRIAICLAVCAAFACAGLAVGLSILLHDNAISNLKWKQEQYKKRLDEEHIRQLNSLGRQPTFDEVIGEPNIPEGFELEPPRKGFWVNLSVEGLVGVYFSVGLIGWLIGFEIIWLIYKILEWLVLGFCDKKP